MIVSMLNEGIKKGKVRLGVMHSDDLLGGGVSKDKNSINYMLTMEAGDVTARRILANETAIGRTS